MLLSEALEVDAKEGEGKCERVREEDDYYNLEEERRSVEGTYILQYKNTSSHLLQICIKPRIRGNGLNWKTGGMRSRIRL